MLATNYTTNYKKERKKKHTQQGSGIETMAGNIVKWWKHKILGGYKQFSGKKMHTHTFIYIYGQSNSVFFFHESKVYR